LDVDNIIIGAWSNIGSDLDDFSLPHADGALFKCRPYAIEDESVRDGEIACGHVGSLSMMKESVG
jgi:hypothetical protein